MMSYTMNMEPKPSLIRDFLSREFTTAIQNQDSGAVAGYLESLAVEDSPASKWAEAVGTRLQIRDFLLQQKGGLASLHSTQSPDIQQSIREYFQGMDTNLAGLTGQSQYKDSPEPRESIKAARIKRLTQENGQRLLELVDGFSHQEVDKILDADSLVGRAVDIRNGVVERLWSAAQTYQEGDPATAHHELDNEAAEVNKDFDRLLESILRWEEAA